MKQRMRTMNQEVARAEAQGDHATRATSASQPIPMADVLPDHTSTAYWEYPMTLDYVVDVGFATDYDGARGEPRRTPAVPRPSTRARP